MLYLMGDWMKAAFYHTRVVYLWSHECAVDKWALGNLWRVTKLCCKLHLCICFVLSLRTKDGVNICHVLCLGLSVLILSNLVCSNLIETKYDLSNWPTQCTNSCFIISLLYDYTCFEHYCAHHQEVKIVLYSIWYHHNCRWLSGAQVERGLCTGQPPTVVMIPDAVQYNFYLLMMSTIVLETCRGI